MARKTPMGEPRRPDPNRAAKLEARAARQASTGGEPTVRPGESATFGRPGRLSQQSLQQTKQGVIERGGQKAWQQVKDYWQSRLQEGGSEPLRVPAQAEATSRPLSASTPGSPIPSEAQVRLAGARAGRQEMRAASAAQGAGEPWTPREAKPGVYETTGVNRAAEVIGRNDVPERYIGVTPENPAELITARREAARQRVASVSRAEDLRKPGPQGRQVFFPPKGPEEVAAETRGARSAFEPLEKVAGGFKGLTSAVRNMSGEQWAELGKGISRGAVKGFALGTVENRVINSSLDDPNAVKGIPTQAVQGMREMWNNPQRMLEPFREGAARVRDVVQRRNPNAPGSRTFQRKVESGEAAWGGPREYGPRTLSERSGQGGNRA